MVEVKQCTIATSLYNVCILRRHSEVMAVLRWGYDVKSLRTCWSIISFYLSCLSAREKMTEESKLSSEIQLL